MSLHSRSPYTDWGDDEDEESMSAIKWISPEPNAVLVSGGKLVATWATPARPIASPSFQLCLVETEDCGDTIWPKVKKLRDGQYTITLKIPQLGSDNDFFVRMVDDKGSVYDTPEFKLQGGGSPSSSLALNTSSSSSSVLPDSLTSDSGSPGSTPSSAGHEGSNGSGSNESAPSSLSPSSSGSGGGDKGRPQSANEGADRSALKNAGKGLGSLVNGTATMSVSGNPTVASATSLALTPSATNRTLIGSSNDNKPSTAAIVVPLAIFAAALAGLLFSLRQRSKAKEIRGLKDEPALNRVTSKDSCASGSSNAGSSRTDLERAMEFIARVRVPHSPNLTPLPPTIESKRRERREIRMRQSDASFRAEVAPRRVSVPTSSSMPDMDQRVQQRDGPLSPIPSVALDPIDVYPQHEIPRSTTCPVVPNHPPGLSQTVVYYPDPDPGENPIHPPTHSLGPSVGCHPDASHTVSVIPATHLPTSLSFAGMPRPPDFAQPQVFATSSSMSQPIIVTGPMHHPASVTPAPPLVLPDSLRAALPRPPTAPVPEIVVNPGSNECLEPQPQPRPEYKPTDQSPTRPRPIIPYSTRPRTIAAQTSVVSNPYDAITKALRTPRLE
ncbi:hypothetical protein FRC11_006067 [Ceratobasidium sp. 423]|nr:hypothetical protein FRC11_006067 [Ceratobasidium sp. 423]